MKLTVIDGTGREIILEAAPGRSVMEVAREAGLAELVALCGGCCACGTCRVDVDPAWIDRLPVPVYDERRLLVGAVPKMDAPRLSCQIRMEPSLDGLRISLSPKV